MVSRLDLDGDRELGLLSAAWDEAAQHWHDDTARHFYASHWTPLVSEARSYLAALRDLLTVLDSADRETGT